ncbi:MAG TPA: DUF6526 family protein [Gemmatimonadales bacterium]|nr:DUF6526 family protein [Gemmatimonadales bacterium]
MPDATRQSLANHARYVPGFHFVATGLLAVNLIWRAIEVVKYPGAGTVDGVLVAVALVLLLWYTRAFAVGVQDRIIRLEERIRMERLLPADLKARIPEFTRAQLISLRFAPDQELPELARKVLAESIDDQAQIKAMVKAWRADEWRV